LREDGGHTAGRSVYDLTRKKGKKKSERKKEVEPNRKEKANRECPVGSGLASSEKKESNTHIGEGGTASGKKIKSFNMRKSRQSLNKRKDPS